MRRLLVLPLRRETADMAHVCTDMAHVCADMAHVCTDIAHVCTDRPRLTQFEVSQFHT